jgi:hypothetical protein
MKKDIRKVIKQIVSEIRLSPGSRGTQFSDEFIQAHNKVRTYISGWYKINDLIGNADRLGDLVEYSPADIEEMIDNNEIMKAAFFAYHDTDIEDITPETDITNFIQSLDSFLEIGEDEVRGKLLDLGWLS